MGYLKCFNDNGSECFGFHKKDDDQNCWPDSGTDENDKLIAHLEAQQDTGESIKSLDYNESEPCDEFENDPCYGFTLCKEFKECKDCPIFK